MIFQWPWPPYGIFSGHYRGLGEGEDKVMLDWRPQAPLADRLASFKAWRKTEIDVIKDHLWPVYNRITREWDGKAVGFAAEASAVEIAIMVDRLQKPGAFALDDTPQTALASPDMPTHRTHYKLEDNRGAKRIPPAGNIGDYDRTLTALERKRAVDVTSHAFGGTYGIGAKISGMFWVKTQLSRPRPYQAAMLVGRDDLVVEIGNTAFHSAMMSGHALQGILLACSIYEDWLDQYQSPSADRLAALAQYAVDWGDRRVFAGVHYPTDNISSWGLALSLTPHVFRHQNKILPFVRAAITEKSRIYQIIREEFTGKNVFEAQLKYLNTKLGMSDSSVG